jgi:alpha-beta hydrolase superfamily lysophospholipase
MSISHCAEFVTQPFAVYFDHLKPDSSAHHPNVVMVHGGSHTGSCYLITAEGKPGWAYRFAERGYRVAVPDWPGHGRSGALNLQTLTGEQVCQSLAALISGLNGPVVLLTHSMGVAFGWACGRTVWRQRHCHCRNCTRAVIKVTALKCSDKRLLRHDHVYPKEKMTDALLNAKPEEVDGILTNVVGCTNTQDEHLRLSEFDGERSGWERYRQAKVPVKNTQTGDQEISADSK